MKLEREKIEKIKSLNDSTMMFLCHSDQSFIYESTYGVNVVTIDFIPEDSCETLFNYMSIEDILDIEVGYLKVSYVDVTSLEEDREELTYELRYEDR